MNAIRQIVEVKNHKLSIELPENFDVNMPRLSFSRKKRNLILKFLKVKKH